MKQLQTVSIVAPGFYGLNTQESSVTLSSNFAQLADNCIIDKFGRLGSRKGWLMQTASGATALAGTSPEFMMEHVNADDTTAFISGGNLKLFTNGIGDALIDVTPASYSITANNWKGATLNDLAMIVQSGHEPLIYDATTTPAVQPITTYVAHSASYGTSYPNDVLAAYGRFWVHDGRTVYWSTDIADSNFPRFSGGTSGTLNIAAVLPNNVDDIVAIAAHNNFLIIFCEHNIVVYSGADNPLADSFQLSDVIAGVGCVARDSVQNTGNDLIFMSDTGIRSLGRIIQERSLPMRDLTKNIRDDFIAEMLEEVRLSGNLNKVRSVYSEVDAFYLILFPSTETVFCLDTRQPLEDGSARITAWYNFLGKSFARLRNRDVVIGFINGVGKYIGYTDNGKSYRMRFFSHYLAVNDATVVKVLKKVVTTLLGGANQPFVIKTGFDYEDIPVSYPFRIEAKGVSEYGVSEYNIAEYSKGTVLDRIQGSIGGAGNVVQIGFEADVKGTPLSIQKLDIFLKSGRIG